MDMEYSVSCSYSNEIVKKEVEKKDMSFALIVVMDKEIYIATDSRSTKIEWSGKKTFSDDYQKIVVIPEKNIAVLSTGFNDFDGKTFAEIVSELPKEDIFNDLFLLAKKYELKKREKTFIFTGSFRLNNECEFVPIIQSTGIDEESGQLLYGYNETPGILYSLGAKYGTDLVKNTDPKSFKPETAVSQIENFMKGIISISQAFDNTVGGPIQMVRITPEKAEWVEGFKPDFIK